MINVFINLLKNLNCKMPTTKLGAEVRLGAGIGSRVGTCRAKTYKAGICKARTYKVGFSGAEDTKPRIAGPRIEHLKMSFL